MSDDTDDIIPFKIDDLDFDKPSTAEDGDYDDDARVVTSMELKENYEVVTQQVPGYKAITQATEPEGLKEITVTVQTFTKDDRDIIDAWTNYSPHSVQCPLLTESPILMYLTNKTRRMQDVGRRQYYIEWSISLKEENDNNEA